MHNMKLSEKLDYLLAKRKLQKAHVVRVVAKAANVSRATAYSWFTPERGTPDSAKKEPKIPDLLAAFWLAKVLGVPMDFLANDAMEACKLDEAKLVEWYRQTPLQAAEVIYKLTPSDFAPGISPPFQWDADQKTLVQRLGDPVSDDEDSDVSSPPSRIGG